MLALVGGTIYPSPIDAAIPDGVILIEDRRIAATGRRGALEIPPEATTIDCTGLTITAGFWNSHVHFFERKWAKAGEIPADELGRQLENTFLRFGFTSVFDLSSEWENTRRIRNRIESGEVNGPRIRSTGLGLLPVNPGLPPDPVMNFMGVIKSSMPEVADAEQAATAARKLLEDGVDAIKLFVSSPSKSSIPESAIQAAVDEAHRAGKPVFVHPNTATDVMAAVRSGADIIGHTTPASGSWDESILTAMKERGVALTPTLSIWKYFLRHDRLSVLEKSVNTALSQLRAWADLGGTVLFGTDLGAVDPDPSEEYGLMSAAGMSFSQILASLTTAPAERFGCSNELGRIAPGYRADLVALRGHPAEDLRVLTDVQYVMRDGELIHSL